MALRRIAAFRSQSSLENRERPRVLAEPIKGRDPGVVGQFACALLDPLVEYLPAVLAQTALLGPGEGSGIWRSVAGRESAARSFVSPLISVGQAGTVVYSPAVLRPGANHDS
jgi:hypothetical protein